MSLAYERPTAPGVLQHTAPRLAVFMSPHLSDEELAFNWTLSERDINFILTNHRGPENLCRLAIQLCVLRQHGQFLTTYAHIPPPILGYLCRQLDLIPLVSLPSPVRSTTETDSQREIAAYLGWRLFDVEAHTELREWVVEQVAQHLYVADLAEKASAQLRTHRIILPGRTTFERTVNAAHAEAEHRIFERLAQALSDETKQAIDGLLGAAPDPNRLPADADSSIPTATAGDVTDFFRFAQYPPEAKAKSIVTYLEWAAELRALQLDPLEHIGIGPALLERLSIAVGTYDAQQLKAFEANKRFALAAAFLYDMRKRLLDYLVEMHARFMTEMQREARNAWEKEHRQVRKRLHQGVTSLRELAETVLALRTSPEVPLSTLLEHIDPHRIEGAVADCAKFERLERYGLLDKLHGKYANFRRYFRSFVDLPFAAESGSESLLDNLALLRQLNRGELKALPPDADTSFVPVAWRGSLQSNEPRRRRTWEISLALTLKDALRSGDVFLPDSRRHVSFWNLCYDESTWQQIRASAFDTLGLPTDGTAAVKALVQEFHDTAAQTERDWASNPFVRIEGGRLRLRRAPRQSEPAGTAALRQLVRRDLSRVRIEQLLMEVDALCGFSQYLTPPTAEASIWDGDDSFILTPERHYSALMAAVVAHGTNLGISAMADSTEDLTVRMLQHVSRTCVREETIRRANAAIVNYHRTLDVSRYWGEGQIASSDGQRFGVRGSSLLAAFYPRYFGYYDRAVSVYTHLSDQYSVFNTQVISCAEREALYVLDGLLENDTALPIRTHIVDTHGCTDQIFGLCYLLGFTFMPRLKNLATWRLFKPVGLPEEGLFGSRSYSQLDTLLSATIDLHLIAEQWEGLVRVAASLKNRVVSANVIARRLASSASSNRLAKALLHLGQLVRTIYLLRYFNDPVMRQQVRTQLNRGEARQDLAQRLFFADQGMFRSGDYYQMMNRASCLSLLSNAVLVYNTLRIGRVLEQAKAQGQEFTLEAIAHISPLARRHVIVNGIYDFSPAHTHHAKEQLCG
jgi:TnpA family transposase